MGMRHAWPLAVAVLLASGCAPMDEPAADASPEAASSPSAPSTPAGPNAQEQLQQSLDQVLGAAEGLEVTDLSIYLGAPGEGAERAVGEVIIEAVGDDGDQRFVKADLDSGEPSRSAQEASRSAPADVGLAPQQLDPGALLALAADADRELGCSEPHDAAGSLTITVQALPEGHALESVRCGPGGGEAPQGGHRGIAVSIDGEELALPRAEMTPEQRLAPVTSALERFTGVDEARYVRVVHASSELEVTVHGASASGKMRDGRPCAPILRVSDRSEPSFSCGLADRGAPRLSSIAPGSTTMSELGATAGITDWSAGNWTIQGKTRDYGDLWVIDVGDARTAYRSDGTEVPGEK